MIVVRPSVPADLPAQRTLWKLAFGDSDAYLDNFYRTYYRPERVLVLEEDDTLCAMTVWFDTVFTLPTGKTARAAYLYALTTHPDCRGRGLCSHLLAQADSFFRGQGIRSVTTVPAEPSLHAFFRRNGFRECFTFDSFRHQAPVPDGPCPISLIPVSPAEYAALREDLLQDIPHIILPRDALIYQAGCSALSGGGLYKAQTAAGPVLLCAEGMDNGTLLGKELLGSPEARELFLPWLPRLLPRFCGLYRCPGPSIPFGMLKWLDPEQASVWDRTDSAYLGLAFD